MLKYCLPGNFILIVQNNMLDYLSCNCIAHKNKIDSLKYKNWLTFDYNWGKVKFNIFLIMFWCFITATCSINFLLATSSSYFLCIISITGSWKKVICFIQQTDFYTLRIEKNKVIRVDHIFYLKHIRVFKLNLIFILSVFGPNI